MSNKAKYTKVFLIITLLDLALISCKSDPPTFIISYDANGGKGTPPASQIKTEGISLTLQKEIVTLTRDGYTFASWNTNRDGTGEDYLEGASYTKDENITLYAKWNPKKYKATFIYTDNCSPATKKMEQAYGTVINTPEITSIPEGKQLYSWNTKQDGNGTDCYVGKNFEIAGNVTLYPIFKTQTFAITYDANEGSGTVPSPQSKEYNVAASILDAAASLTKAGYEAFYACNTEKDGKGTIYFASDNYDRNEDIILYAVFSKALKQGDVTRLGVDENGVFKWDNQIYTSVANMAFRDTQNLKKIIIPNTVKSIEHWSFFICSTLEALEIPQSVEKIDGNFFYQCDNLKNITVDENNSKFSSEKGLLYNKDRTKLLAYPSTEKIDLAPTTTTIGTNAFYGSALTEFDIPRTVTTIEGNAFDSAKIGTIKIPSSVTSIANCAFWDANNLKIEVEEGNPNYSSDTDGVLYNKEKTILHSYPSASGDYTISNGVTEIGMRAFSSCDNLTSVVMPNSVTTIVVQAFDSCSNLEKVTISSSVKSIERTTFSGCNNLKNIKFEGTKAQWDNINFGYAWNNTCSAITLTCTQGTVDTTDDKTFTLEKFVN